MARVDSWVVGLFPSVPDIIADVHGESYVIPQPAQQKLVGGGELGHNRCSGFRYAKHNGKVRDVRRWLLPVADGFE